MPLVLDPTPTTGPTFNIDGYDFFPYIRVAPGEGLDPADADFLEPQFSESAVGAGDPLLSIRERNREVVWPLYLHDVNKAALHQLVRDVNRVLRNARQIQWKEEGATNSTFLDVVFARFEADYSYRPAQKFWLKGILRCYTKPYGTTGTSRLVGTAAGTGVALAVPLGTLEGDAPALVEALVQSGSQAFRTARAVGVALVPSGYVFEVPAASLIRHADATLMAASGAVGSQALAVLHAVGRGNFGVPRTRDLGQVALSPASVYEGRNRLFAIANHEWMPGAELQAFDDRGVPLGPGSLATVANQAGWGLVDLGVLDVDSSDGRATAVARIRSKGLAATGGWSHTNAADGATMTYARVARVLVLPEDDVALALDTRRRQLGLDTFDAAGSGPLANIDALGNQWRDLGLDGPMWQDGDISSTNHYSPTLTGYKALGSRLGHPTAADLLIDAPIINLSVVSASAAVAVGKHHHLSPFFARYQARPSPYISIQGGTGLLVGTTIASLGISGATVAGYLTMHMRGPAIDVVLRDNERRVLATLGASHADADEPGQAMIAAKATLGGFQNFFGSIRVAEVPSQSLGGRDRVELDAVNRAAPKTSLASVYLERVDTNLRGALPEADPVRHAQLVALTLPIDGGLTNDLLNAEVRVRESFVYARS